jgi:transglutaminase-like putative cysteine protease/tetratricopeptide (TPR) repeat protein
MTFRLPAAVCRCALLLFLLSLTSLPLAAGDIWDAAPFSADPKAMLAAAATVDAKGSSVVYLLNEQTYAFEADGRTKMTWRLIQRVATEDGAAEAGTASAWWAPWYDEKPTIASRVVSADGVVHSLDPKAVVEATGDFEQDMFSDQRVLRAPLPGVTTGSIVETVITTLGRSPIAGGGKYGRFDFGSGSAVERSRLVLDAAAGVTPQIVNKSGIEPKVAEQNGRRVTIFEKGHTDAIEEEEILPPDELAVPYVAFATGTSWAEIAKNYSTTVDEQIAAASVKDLVAKTIGDSTDRNVKIEKLLDVIRKNIRYAGVEVGDGSIIPRSPSFVLQNKYGDCKDKATLLVAMLRAAGIDAHVALLNAGFDFDTVASLPASNAFNHAIVVVSGEPSLWIDPTDEFSRAGELPLQDQARMALIAAPGTSALVRTPETASTTNRYVETRTFTLPEDGRSHVIEVTEGSSREDAALRRDYATAEKKAYRESLEKYATDYYLATKIESVEAGDPHDFAKPFRLTIDITKSKSGVVYDGEADVLIPTYNIVSWLPLSLRNYEPKNADAPLVKADKKRVHDFVFARPLTREWIYRVVPPPGFRAQTLPASETTKLGTTTLTTEYTQQPDGSVSAKLVFDTGKRRISAAEYEATRTSVSAFARQDGVHLRFESAGQAKLAAGDIRGALVEFRQLAVAHPKEAQHHIELARALLAGGLGEAAREEAKRAVATEGSSAKAHAMLATVLEHDLLGREHRSGCDIAGAVAELRKAKDLDKTDMTLGVRLAELLMFGSDGYRFGRGAHLTEAEAEYRSLMKDFPKEATSHQPRLMLILSYLGKWNEVKELVKTERDTRQRDLFRLLSVTAIDGSAAGLRELAAFDTNTRRNYGTVVGQTFMQLRRYSDAADFMEAAAKGSDDASKQMPLVEMLRKTQPYEKTLDGSAKALIVQMMAAFAAGDTKAVQALFIPEVVKASTDDSDFNFNFHMLTNGGETRPEVVLDVTAAALELQPDGNEDLGFRYRTRAGIGNARSKSIYVVRRGGKLLLAATSDAPSLIGHHALQLANAGKLDAARTWLNWARESIAAGGGDDPLDGAPFAKLWQKETATATADEIRVAAAALMDSKEFGKDSAAILEPARDKAANDAAKTAIDIALVKAYVQTKDWAKALPISERLATAHPDSDSAFAQYTITLAENGKAADAEKLANERLAKRAKNEAAMRALQNLTARRGDYESAEKWARKLIEDVEPNENDYNEAAWVALFRGKELDRAIEDARHATSDGSGGSAAALHTLAAVYAETGNTTEARQALLKSLDSRASAEPRSFDWFVLGRIAESYGVSDAAAAAYKRVTKEEPNGLTTWELTQKRLASLAK